MYNCSVTYSGSYISASSTTVTRVCDVQLYCKTVVYIRNNCVLNNCIQLSATYSCPLCTNVRRSSVTGLVQVVVVDFRVVPVTQRQTPCAHCYFTLQSGQLCPFLTCSSETIMTSRPSPPPFFFWGGRGAGGVESEVQSAVTRQSVLLISVCR